MARKAPAWKRAPAAAANAARLCRIRIRVPSASSSARSGWMSPCLKPIQDAGQDNSLNGGDFLPANIELSGAETQLLNEIGRETILKEKLRPILRRYDFVVIDCPPALSLITINAFVAADQVIIPLQCEYF